MWQSGKSVDLMQIEYFKINIITKSPFLYEYDAPYIENLRFLVFL